MYVYVRARMCVCVYVYVCVCVGVRALARLIFMAIIRVFDEAHTLNTIQFAHTEI